MSAQQPAQVFVVTLTVSDEVERVLAFQQAPSLEEIAEAITQGNAFYTDHDGSLVSAHLALQHFINLGITVPVSASSTGWSRFATSIKARLTMQSVDFFPSTVFFKP